MHSFDPELVAALAEGTLGAAEGAALEARIAADPAAAAELAAQRAALAAIRGAGSPHLDGRERTALHAAVAQQLGLSSAGAPAAIRRRRMAWGPIAVAATTLVAIVAFAPMVGDLAGKSGDDDAAVTAEAATTVAPDQGAFDAIPLGSESPPQPTVAAAGTTAGEVLESGDQYATTTMAGAMRSTYLPAVADDLVLLKGDPEALIVLERPVDETTACRVEAEQYFGTAGLNTFDYPAESVDPAVVPITYVVFLLAAPDGNGPRTLVAFDPANCSTPIVVP